MFQLGKDCFDFNKGNCQYRQKCKFEHKYSFCNKFGHGFFNCRKAAKVNNPGNGGARDGKDDQDRWDKYEREQQNLVNTPNNLNSK